MARVGEAGRGSELGRWGQQSAPQHECKCWRETTQLRPGVSAGVGEDGAGKWLSMGRTNSTFSWVPEKVEEATA